MGDVKAVLITGAAQRIGACIAATFHRQGFNVIVHYRRSDAAADRLVSQFNQQRSGSAVALQADLTLAEQVETLGNQTLEQFGRLDVLVNNASSFYPTEFGKTSQSQWDDLFDSNLRAGFFLSQGLSAELVDREGAIVNIIDTHADKPLARHAAYSIAKAGLKAMTKALALELAPSVRVNGVSPGAILWPSSLEDSADMSTAAAQEKILQQIPAGRLGKAEDIADAVYFLATGASYITGHVLRVDGGRYLGK